MADDRLITALEVDPSGVTRGVQLMEADLKRFETLVRGMVRALPGLDVSRIARDSAAAFREQAAAAAEVERKVRAVVDATNRPVAFITRDKVADLKLLAGQLQQVPQVADAAGASVRRMSAAFDESGRAAARAKSGHDAWARGMANLAGGTQATGRAFTAAQVGGSRLINTLGNITVGTIGLSGKLGTVVSNLLVFGAGVKGVIGITVAIVALAKTYEFLTSSIRKASKEQEALAKAVQERAKAEREANVGAQRQAVESQVARLREEAELTDQVRRNRFLIVAAILAAVTEMVRGNKVEEKSRDLAQDTARAHRDAARVALDATRERLQMELDIRRAIISGAEAQVRARLERAQASGRATFGAQPGAISNEERRAFDERIALARQLADAEVAAAEARRVVAQGQLNLRREDKTLTDEHLAVEQSRVDAMSREVELARLQGALRVQAIQDELEFLRVQRNARQEEIAHLNRVASIAGGGNRVQGAGGRPPLPGGIPLIQQGARAQGLSSGAVGYARDMAAVVAQIRLAKEEARFLAEAEKAARTEAERLADAFVQVGGTVSAFAQVGQELGFIDAQAAAAIRTVSDLANALANVAVSASAGNILGAIVAGAGLVGAIFGESEAQRAALEVQRENNRRLKELRDELIRLNLGPDAEARAARAASFLGADDDRIAQIARFRQIFNGTADAFEYLDGQLRAFGLSFEELNAIAAEHGIALLDEEGRIVVSAFDDLAEIIGLSAEQMEAAAKAAREFGDSLAEVTRQNEVRNKVFGLGKTDLELNRDRLLAGLDLGPVWESMIARLDLDTESGRAVYQRWLQTLFELAEQGKLTTAQLGIYADVAELLDDLGAGADALARAHAEMEAAEEAAARGLVEEAEARKRAAEEIIQAALEEAQARREAAEAAREEARRLATLRSRIAGDPQDAAARFRRELDILAAAIPGLGDAFRGFDLSDPAIMQDFRARLLTWLDQMPDIDPALRAEFEALLGLGADVLGEFAKSVDDATKSVRGLPAGINLAALEFRAQAASPIKWQDVWGTDPRGGVGIMPYPRGGDGVSIALPGMSADGGAGGATRDLVRALESGGLARNLQRFAAALEAVARGNPDEAARQIVESLRVTAGAREGNRDAWSGRTGITRRR